MTQKKSLAQRSMHDRENAQSDGAYYTREPAALLLAMLAADVQMPTSHEGVCTVLDPACGSGILLKAAKTVADARGYAVRLIGIDIDRNAVLDAREMLGPEAHLYIAPYGPQPDGSMKAGTLELFEYLYPRPEEEIDMFNPPKPAEELTLSLLNRIFEKV